MSRKTETVSDSLDLLLDTICNTFGGVLFISMLVIVLVNMSSQRFMLEPPESVAQTELIELKQRLARTQEELEQLRTLSRQQGLLETELLDPHLEELAVRLKTSMETRDQLVQLRNKDLQSIAQFQAETNRVALELRELEVALQEAAKELKQMDSELRAETKARTRTTELPIPRQTRKVEIAFILQQGRLTCYATRSPDGSPAECIEKTDSKGTYLEPKPNGGTLVDPASKSGAPLAARLSEFDPNWHYIAVAVSPDSFPHFAAFRNAMIASGFEYRLIPLREGERVYISADPGDVKVQ